MGTQVAGIVFWEVLIQGVLAAFLAAIFGIPLSLYFQAHGIDLSSISGGTSMLGIAFDPIWYCEVTPSAVVIPVVAMLGLVILAAIYPGIKAAVISPSTARTSVSPCL